MLLVLKFTSVESIVSKIIYYQNKSNKMICSDNFVIFDIRESTTTESWGIGTLIIHIYRGRPSGSVCYFRYLSKTIKCVLDILDGKFIEIRGFLYFEAKTQDFTASQRFFLNIFKSKQKTLTKIFLSRFE